MRRIYLVFALFFCLVAALPVFFHSIAPNKLITYRQDLLSIQTAAGKNHRFSVEIADTSEKWEQGLMHRNTLADDHGMLFIFDTDAAVQMWMKNTLISLDMLFIDSHGIIVYIAPNTIPNSTAVISANRNVRSVLELAAGVTEKLGIKTGDQLIYPYFKP